MYLLSIDFQLMEMYIQTPEKYSFKSTHFFLDSGMCSNLAETGILETSRFFTFSSPFLKLPVNFHHQYFATGIDMAKMHWFILEGEMFTEIKPDSVKAKHRLQHETPLAPKKNLSSNYLTYLRVSSTLPLILLCHVSGYIIMCFQLLFLW